MGMRGGSPNVLGNGAWPLTDDDAFELMSQQRINMHTTCSIQTKVMNCHSILLHIKQKKNVKQIQLFKYGIYLVM